MKKPKPLIGEYSWLGIVNICLLQWFCIRLQAALNFPTCEKITRFQITGPVLPLTGWNTPYQWLGTRRILTIWTFK